MKRTVKKVILYVLATLGGMMAGGLIGGGLGIICTLIFAAFTGSPSLDPILWSVRISVLVGGALIPFLCRKEIRHWAQQ